MGSAHKTALAGHDDRRHGTGLAAMLEDGGGGGAIGVPLFGMAAGYALTGRGPTWGRVVTGVIALAPIPIWVLVVPR